MGQRQTIATQRGQLADLLAELERLRPVYAAALAWRVGRDRDIVGTAPAGGSRSETGRALIDAIDRAEGE